MAEGEVGRFARSPLLYEIKICDDVDADVVNGRGKPNEGKVFIYFYVYIYVLFPEMCPQ